MADERLDSQERTESPTPRRRQQAHEEGRVAKSQELTSAVVLLAGAVALGATAGPSLARFAFGVLRESARGLAHGPMDAASGIGLVRGLTLGFVLAILPFVLAVAASATVVNLIQARGVMTMKPLQPQWNRIDPMAGIKRLVSLDSTFNLVKSIAKLLALGFVTWLVIAHAFPELSSLAQTGPAGTTAVLRSLAMRLAVLTGIAFLVVAAADYAFQVFRLEKSLRMSRQEIVREHKESEGDPMVKARILSIMRARARQRMLQQVPQADVVVVNPTEVAVALKYDADLSPAPVVLAMGERKLAQRIRDLATKAGVPIVENRPVARALLATAAVGKPIPPALYAAVAEILAFVYRRRGKFPASLLPQPRTDA